MPPQPKLEDLKALLVEATELKDILAYFFDHFGENPVFLARGSRAKHAKLQAILPKVAEQIFLKPVSKVQLRLTALPAQKFIHGAGSIEGKPIAIIYFDDIDVGLLAVAMDMRGAMQYCRFTTTLLSQEGKPYHN